MTAQVELWKVEHGEAYQPAPFLLALLAAGKFEDYSWHNDTCPRFESAEKREGRKLVVFLEAVRPEDREDPIVPRYNFYWGDDEKIEDTPLYCTEDDADAEMVVGKFLAGEPIPEGGIRWWEVEAPPPGPEPAPAPPAPDERNRPVRAAIVEEINSFLATNFYMGEPPLENSEVVDLAERIEERLRRDRRAPRVLVTLTGGLPNICADDEVEVVYADFDSQEEPELAVPPAFADLAAEGEVPFVRHPVFNLFATPNCAERVFEGVKDDG